MKSLIVIAAAIGAFAGAARAESRPPTAAAACDARVLDEVERALAKKGEAPSDLSLFAAFGVGEACPSTPAIRKMFAADPALRETAAARAVADDPAAWRRACSGGTEVFGPAAGEADMAGALARATWKGCDVAGFGIADEKEWSRARHVVAALFARRMLLDGGVAAARVRAFVRAIAELPPRG
jgi:hypothetical protein